MIRDIQCPNCDNVTEFAAKCQCCGCGLPEDFTPDPALHPTNLSLISPGNIDPKIERQIGRHRNEIYRPAGGSMMEGEIPVILAVEAGSLLPNFVREILRIKAQKEDKPSMDIVTARISIGDLGRVDESWIVKCPSIARSFTSTGFENLEKEIRSIPEELSFGRRVPQDEGGRSAAPAVNVVVGVIDFGIDFAHAHFLRDGRTRIRAIWNQAGNGKNPPDVGYGTVHRSDDIDRALRADDPYEALGYGPPEDSLFDTGAHGTYVTDIAAGSGCGGRGAGFAPDADIVFVDLARVAEHNFVGSRYGDSAQLLEAVDFIIREAKNDPCVINISLGSNDGPHDGTTLVEMGIDRLIREKGNCSVVIAGGNTRDQNLHATGKILPNSIVDLIWYVPPYDMTSNEIEVWYPAGAGLTVQILDPDNAPVSCPVGPDKSVEVTFDSGGSMLIVHRKCDPVHERFLENGRKGVIHIFYERRAGYLKKGRWKLRLRNERPSGEEISFDAWIERDERGQSVFVDSCNPSYEVSDDNTLNSIAHGELTVIAGSSRNGKKASSFTGYSTKLGKPDLLAPGEGVLSARSRTVVLRYRQDGTSISAAVVTGYIARMITQGLDPAYEKIKAELCSGERVSYERGHDPLRRILRS